jgi:hypothetical protein
MSAEERDRIHATAVEQFLRELTAWQRLMTRDDKAFLRQNHISPE